jgi:starch-binding outer membrane protein SusE/F
MKNLIANFLILGFILLLASCKKDEYRVTYEGAKSEIMLAGSKSEIILIKDSANNEAISFNWNNPEYGFNTGVNSQNVTYTLQIDTVGGNFVKPQEKKVVSDLSLALTMAELNGYLSNLQLAPEVGRDVQVRIISTIGSDVTKVISNVLTLNVRPYDESTVTFLWVPGDFQGWNPAGAPKLAAIDKKHYEGYVWIPGNGTRAFKFTSAPDWDHTNYGNGGTAGALSKDGGAGDNKWPASATGQYYKVSVNTDALTWTADATTWSVIGSGTAGGWSTDTPMTFDESTKTWKATLPLVNGAIKFRANNDWTINLGAGTGNLLTYGGPDIVVEAGTKVVTLNLSDPPNYTYSIQ